MKTLFVGDIHAQINNLEDTKNIFQLINSIRNGTQIDNIVFLGDIFHTHAIIRQEVAYCVRECFKSLSFAKEDIYVIGGNHDGSSPSSVHKNASDLILSDLCQLSNPEEVTYFQGMPYHFLSFVGSPEKFIELTKNGTVDDILICHQTFTGAKYENGFYAPDGVNQDMVGYGMIISGHIHSRQVIGKVHYIGSCRAISANEVNDSKYLMIFDTDSNTFTKEICTDDWVKCFKDVSFYQTKDTVQLIDLNKFNLNYVFRKQADDIRVHIYGDEQYYFDFIEINKGIIGLVRFIPHIKKEISGTIDIDKEGTTIDQEFKRYVYEISKINDDIKDAVWQKIQNYRK